MQSKRLSLIQVLVAAGIGVGFYLLLLTDRSNEDDGIVLAPEDAAVVAEGEEIYRDHCASCHKQDLSGEPGWRERDAQGLLPAPPHDETGHTWHHPDPALFRLTKYGPAALAGSDYRSNMPAYEAVLSDEEIIAVLSYIKSQWPEDIREKHDAINARSREE
jgi:mono/diheme cytochrome c family protein